MSIFDLVLGITDTDIILFGINVCLAIPTSLVDNLDL